MSLNGLSGYLDIPNANLRVAGAGQFSSINVGSARIFASYDLDVVTSVGSITPYTIEFSNATTGIVTTSNGQIGGDLTVLGNAQCPRTSLWRGTPPSRRPHCGGETPKLGGTPPSLWRGTPPSHRTSLWRGTPPSHRTSLWRGTPRCPRTWNSLATSFSMRTSSSLGTPNSM